MVVDFDKIIKIPGIQNFLSWNSVGGPFKDFSIKTLSDDDPKWFICSLMLSNNPIGTLMNSSNGAAGSSIYLEDSITSCVGEAFERYTSFNYFLTEKPHMLNVDNSKGYVRCGKDEKAPESFKFDGIKTPIPHSEVKSLIDDSIDYVPYELVHLGYLKLNENELFASPVSTGCAFHIDKVSAICRGLCEVIERHSLMTWWYKNMKNTREIDVDDFMTTDIHERIARVQDVGLRLRLFEISVVEGFPVVLCIVSGDKYPYFSCGASCSLNIRHSIQKSIDEAIAIRTMAKFMGPLESFDTVDFSWVKKLEDHMRLYASWKHSPIIERLFELDAPKFDSKNIKEVGIYTMNDLRAVAVNLKDIGFDVYYKDITMPEIKELGCAYKVIIPQMIHLSQCENCKWLSPLLEEGMTMADINPYPQPFS